MGGILSAEVPPRKTLQRPRREKNMHQSTQGLYKEWSAVAKRQMQNNLHEKPDHDPSSSSFPSQTVSPSRTQLLLNIKAHLCHIKAERQGGGGDRVCPRVARGCTEDLELFLKAKTNQFSYFFHMTE